ncbi:hypothetical protein F5Y18DRAFT_78598 [Xylariaceae sp. FL1019]|nr:hypothetical protein F5Y18DRAFT_78598 [Xylariaceae sp. FL1019]
MSEAPQQAQQVVPVPKVYNVPCFLSFTHVNCDGDLQDWCFHTHEYTVRLRGTIWDEVKDTEPPFQNRSPDCSDFDGPNRDHGYRFYFQGGPEMSDMQNVACQGCSYDEPASYRPVANEAEIMRTVYDQIKANSAMRWRHAHKPRRGQPPSRIEVVNSKIYWDLEPTGEVSNAMDWKHTDVLTLGHLVLMRLRGRKDYIQVDFKTELVPEPVAQDRR